MHAHTHKPNERAITFLVVHSLSKWRIHRRTHAFIPVKIKNHFIPLRIGKVELEGNAAHQSQCEMLLPSLYRPHFPKNASNLAACLTASSMSTSLANILAEIERPVDWFWLALCLWGQCLSPLRLRWRPPRSTRLTVQEGYSITLQSRKALLNYRTRVWREYENN